MESKTKTSQDTGAIKAPMSCLLDKKVRLRPIQTTSPITTNKNEATMMSGTSRSLICPIDNRTGRYVDPLTPKEREYLEEITGENLDVNKVGGCYWDKARLTIYKTTQGIDETYRELNLNNPYDYLLYKMALVCPEVSSKKEDAYPASKMYFVDDLEVETVEQSKYYMKLDACIEHKLGIKADRDKMYNFLRAFNFLNNRKNRVSRDSTIEWLYTTLSELMEDSRNIDKVYELVETIKKDPATYELNLFIQDALQLGEIQRKASGMSLASGEPLGNSLEDVRFFFSDVKNQLVKERIKSQIKLQLK